jgi:hypothetical protein
LPECASHSTLHFFIQSSLSWFSGINGLLQSGWVLSDAFILLTLLQITLPVELYEISQ